MQPQRRGDAETDAEEKRGGQCATGISPMLTVRVRARRQVVPFVCPWLLRLRMSGLFAALEQGEFFVEAGNHFAHAGLGESLGANGVGLLEPPEPVLEVVKLLLCLGVLDHIRNHSSISTRP